MYCAVFVVNNIERGSRDMEVEGTLTERAIDRVEWKVMVVTALASELAS